MATIDSNGVLFYQDTDSFTPPASLNLAQSNLSDLLAAGVRFKRVANTTARSALVTSIGLANVTTANPLHVWRADATAGKQYEYTTNGTTWHTVVTSEQDTGWVNVTVGSGYTAAVPVQVRRIGIDIKWRGSVTKGTAWTSSYQVVIPAANIPTWAITSRSTADSASTLHVASTAIDAIGVILATGLNVALSATTSSAVNLKGLSGYTTD